MSKISKPIKHAFVAVIQCKDISDGNYSLYENVNQDIEYDPELALAFKDRADPDLVAIVARLKKTYNAKGYSVKVQSLTGAKVNYIKSKNK